MKIVLFVGPFCPPVTGQTFMTDYIYEQIKRHNSKEFLKINIVRGNTNSWLLNSAIRLYRILLCLLRIVEKKEIDNKSLYLSVDANTGMYITILICLVARMFGYKIILHHHSYSHLICRKMRMVILSNLVKSCAIHVNICEFMSQRMKTLYPAVKNTLNMTNAIALPEKIIYKTFADRTTDTINIGFMGKLCEEKGIFDAIKVLSKLMEEGENVKLMIAGSVGSSEIKNQINNLVNEYGDRHIKYLGPVFGADKENFYNNIDVFLFPTRYINETQGIVNIEAMSYGVPVVAFGRCCVPTDVGEDGGLIVPVGGDYVACATSYIKEMNSSSEIYNKRRLDAHCQFKKIKKQSHKEYSEFLKLM